MAIQFEKEEGLKKDLRNRHIQLIAIGGVIGVALFMGSTLAVKAAGPAVSLAFIIGGIIMYFVLRALGELAIEYPVTASFVGYAKAFIGPKASFLLGWTYWFMWTTIGMCEISAVGMFMKYWYPDITQWIVAIITLAIMTGINLIAVKLYGELEFWFALIKVIAIIFMIITGSLMIVFGLGNGGVPIGISNLWNHGGFMPFGFKGVATALVMVTFCYGGAEMIGVTAGEAVDAEHSLKSAIDKLFWRILIFYVCSIIVILAIIPWYTLEKGVSPFVLIFEKLGIPYAASIMNAIIISSAASCLNSCMYTAGRILWGLGLRNEAPKFFRRLSGSGVPANGILFTAVVALIGVYFNYTSPDTVFYFISSATVTSQLWAWGNIAIEQINFRKTLSIEAVDKLKYKMPFSPYANYLTLAFIVAVLFGMCFDKDNLMGLYAGAVWYTGLMVCYYIFKVADRQKQVDSNIKIEW